MNKPGAYFPPFFALLLLHAFTAAAQDSIPAFPGAEGWGAYTPGGRGGQVIHVTTLANNGPGSLQEALNTPGPRIIVFDVGGVIEGDIEFDQGQVTVLGQTAPSPGITLHGGLFTVYQEFGAVRYEDIVIRYLRIRPRARSQAVTWADGIQLSNVFGCVLDHLSLSWASDETVDIYSAQDITVQWCSIEESDLEGHTEGPHNYGMISGPDGGPISIHHTLFAHHRRRTPAVANGPSDVRNNVIYNFRDGFLHDNEPNGETFNIVGNYWKFGPSELNVFPFCFVAGGHYYLRDNYIYAPLFKGTIQDPWAEKDSLYGLSYYSDRGIKETEPGIVPPVDTQDPQEAYESVLSMAGCFPRDTVGRRTVGEVRSGGGSWGRHEPENLMEGLRWDSAVVDEDRDGMADAWEATHGLDPEDGGDHITLMESGYTAIEEYANMLADELTGRPDGLCAKGDMDWDGDRDILDLVRLLLAVKFGAADSWPADVNYDGRVELSDLVRLVEEL